MFRFALFLCFLFIVAPVCTRGMLDEAEFEADRVKRSDDPSLLQNVVDALSQKLIALEAKVAAQDSSMATLQQKISTLETRVAFHAVSSNDDITTVARGTIILPRVLTNFENAYSPQSGFFTAPVSGLYLFHAKIMNVDFNDYIHAGIYVGGAQMAITMSDQRHGYRDNPSMLAIVHVNKGQIVQLKSADNEVDHFYHGEFTSFSGLLVSAD